MAGARRRSKSGGSRLERDTTLDTSLGEELAALRSSLRLVLEDLQASDEDVVKLGGLVARLCDSIGKALVTRQKLAASDDGASRLRAELHRVLREIGMGES